MNQTLVRYRTGSYTTDSFAVIPTLWLSDLCEWLNGPHRAIIMEVAHNYDSYDLLLPDAWPSYQRCLSYAHAVALMGR